MAAPQAAHDAKNARPAASSADWMPNPPLFT
jgi:hypothetical protein